MMQGINLRPMQPPVPLLHAVSVLQTQCQLRLPGQRLLGENITLSCFSPTMEWRTKCSCGINIKAATPCSHKLWPMT